MCKYITKKPYQNLKLVTNEKSREIISDSEFTYNFIKILVLLSISSC